jgi:hypothetical protein
VGDENLALNKLINKIRNMTVVDDLLYDQANLTVDVYPFRVHRKLKPYHSHSRTAPELYLEMLDYYKFLKPHNIQKKFEDIILGAYFVVHTVWHLLVWMFLAVGGIFFYMFAQRIGLWADFMTAITGVK